MTKHVKTISSEKSLSECLKLMKDYNVGSVVVLEKNEIPAGIFTERDLINVAAGGSLDLKMNQVMSKPLTAISPTATLWDAISLMGKKDIRRLPVVDKGKLVGIFTERDVFRLLIVRQSLILESVAEYLPATTREQLQSLIGRMTTGTTPPKISEKT